MLANQTALAADDSSPWQTCLAVIHEKVGSSTFETWFRTTELMSSADGRPVIQVPNRFFADFIEEHFADLIRETLAQHSIPSEGLAFQPIERDWETVDSLAESMTEARKKWIPRTVSDKQRFHPNYTFESFVVGDGSRMAHAAALAVAEAPGKTTFNPLVVYGGTGLGKTHLLQAIGHFAQTEGTCDRVVYLTSEEFTNQYINYVVNKRDSTSFYRKFTDVDLLLIDDIQFFSGKPGTQKEFFRVFNKLLMERRQIVLSSDRPPDQIPDMMTHIISRFMGGLIADIQPPNLETRMAILRKKAEIDGVSLPDDVASFIAANINSNVRELEGILIKLIASSSFAGRDISLEVAREICGDLISRKDERLSVRCIQEKVAEEFGVSPNQLSAHTRKRDVSLPRSVAMYLCKKWTKQSLRTIGVEFGGRDYSTVIHSFKKIEAAIQESAEIRGKVEHVEQIIQAYL
jgi:chromosomal replication initiator protein